MSRVPDFIILGAQKSGTTTLYDDLAALPQLCLPANKEPHILHRSADPAVLRRHFAAHFHDARTGQLCGEASTTYTMVPWFDDVSTRAFDICGARCKLIYIMRDPVDRIRSQLAHDRLSGRLTHDDYDRAVREEERYIAISDYPRQLAPWVAAFGRSQLLAIDFRSYIGARGETVQRTAAFLGLHAAAVATPESVRNQKGEQRRVVVPGLGRLVNAPLYHRFLRPLPPRRAFDLAKRMLSRSSALPTVTLAPETVALIRARLADMPDRLEELLGERFDFPGLAA